MAALQEGHRMPNILGLDHRMLVAGTTTKVKILRKWVHTGQEVALMWLLLAYVGGYDRFAPRSCRWVESR